MATSTTAPTKAYAHCVNARCPGNAQEQVDAVRVLTEYRYRDFDPKCAHNGIERSYIEHQFAHPKKDSACPHCAGRREITDQQRPDILGLSGHAQDGLLTIKNRDGTFKVTEKPENPEMADLKQQVQALTALVVAQNTPPAEPAAVEPEKPAKAKAA